MVDEPAQLQPDLRVFVHRRKLRGRPRALHADDFVALVPAPSGC